MYEEEKRIYETVRSELPPDLDLAGWASATRSVADQTSLLVRRRSRAGEAELQVLDALGGALSRLELLSACCIGLGQTMIDEVDQLRLDTTIEDLSEVEVFRLNRYEIVKRFWHRAALVSSEIISLLRGGFAAAALARWRTLHELDVISYAIGLHLDIETALLLNNYELRQVADFTRDKEWHRELSAGMLRGNYGWADALVAEALPGYRKDTARRKSVGPSFPELQASVGVRARERQLYKAANAVVHGGMLTDLIEVPNSVGSGGSSEHPLDMAAPICGTAATTYAITGNLSELAEFAGGAIRKDEFERLEGLNVLVHRAVDVPYTEEPIWS